MTSTIDTSNIDEARADLMKNGLIYIPDNLRQDCVYDLSLAQLSGRFNEARIYFDHLKGHALWNQLNDTREVLYKLHKRYETECAEEMMKLKGAMVAYQQELVEGKKTLQRK